MSLEQFITFSDKAVSDIDGFLDRYADFHRLQLACRLSTIRIAYSETQQGPAPQGNLLTLPQRQLRVELNLGGHAYQPLTPAFAVTLQWTMEPTRSLQPAIEAMERLVDHGNLVLVAADFYSIFPDQVICYDPGITVLPDQYATVFGTD